ncbi:MAG: hypothetical protein IJY79_06565 [Clostridia bacterium]|nr:hypothetical protein [Clostridia bacterium]
MSIAEKVTTIAENTPKVYNKGYEDGKQTEYDRFWDSIYEYIEQNNTERLFMGFAWNDTTFKPSRNIVVKPYGRWTFQYCGVKNLKACLDDRGIKIDFTDALYLVNFFSYSGIEHIGEIDLSTCVNAVAISDIFTNMSKLVTIEKIKLGDNIRFYGMPFSQDVKLQNITFEGELKESIGFAQSSLLTNASIQNIIDCLADLTDTDTQTFTVHADVYKKIIANGWDALITAKNWTLVY